MMTKLQKKITFYCSLILGIMLFTINENTAQDINMDVCSNVISCPLELNATGATVIDEGITRNVYSSDPPQFDNLCGGSYIEVQVIWDDVQNRWEIRYDADALPLTYGLDMYYNDFASFPDPPDQNTGTWILDTHGISFACNLAGFTLSGSGTQTALSTNTTPTIAVTDFNYTEGQNSGNPVQVDGTATASDADDNWDGGSLTIQITTNNEAGDEISITETGLTLSGANVQDGGTTFGTISETSGTANDGVVTNGDLLTITFNSNATDARIQTLVRAIGYRSTSAPPGTSARTVAFVLSDDTEGNTDNVTINLTALRRVNLSVSSNTGTEEAGTVITVTATASSAVSGNQTVDLGVSGTNVTNSDYSLSNTTITILDGMTTGSVTFTIVDDDVFEGVETSTITMSNPSAGLILGATTIQNVGITDNETVTVSLIPVPITVGEAAGNAGVTAVLLDVPAGGMEVAVNFTVTPSDGTATAGADYTASAVNGNFASSSSTNTTTVVNIAIIDDNTFESNESFTVTLTSSQSGVNLGAATSHTVNITDNETVNIAFTANTYTANEFDGSVNVEAIISGIPAGGLEVAIPAIVNTADDSAVAPGDYTALTNQTMNFATATTNGATATFPITIINDTNMEGAEAFTVTLTSSLTGVNIISPASSNINIADDDLPEIEVTVGGISITDGDMNANVANVSDFGDVCVNTSTVNVTYTITNTGTAVMTITAPVLSGSSDFSVTAGVTGTTIPAGGSTTFTVTFDPSSVGMKTATITIANNDSDENPFDFLINGDGIQAAVSIAISGNNNENENSGHTISYIFTRTGCLTGDLVVNFSIAGTTNDENTGDDFNVSFTGISAFGSYADATNSGTITIGAGQATATLVITPVGDNTVEKNETVIVSITP